MPHSRVPLVWILVLALGGTLLAVGVGRTSSAGILPALHWPEMPDFELPGIPVPDLSARLRDPRLVLRTIDFLGLRKLESRELAGRLDLPRSTFLVDVDPAEVCATLERHPRVAGCRAVRVPPSRLIVAIDEREPLAVLEKSREGIDADGQRFALGAEELEGLPRLSGEPREAVRLARAARQANVDLARISTSANGGLVFELADSPVRVRVIGDPERALEAWLRVVKSGLNEERGAHEVDLRFRGSAVLRDFRDNNGGE